MTVASIVNTVILSGDGAGFEYPFTNLEVFSAAELTVYILDANGVFTTPAQGTGAANWSVVFNNNINDGKTDGVMTYPADKITPLTANDTVIITRTPDLLQGTRFGNLGIRLPATLETVLDKMQHQILYLQDQLNRVPKLPRGYNTTGLSFDLPRPIAGQAWRWDADADAMEAVTLVDSGGTVKDLFTALTDTPSTLASQALKRLRVNAGESALEFFGEEMAIFQWQLANGSNGGGVVEDAWTKSTLNTTHYNSITGASISSDVITLPAGTYYVRGWKSFFTADRIKLRVRNTTDSSTAVVGGSDYNVTGSQNNSPIEGVFTIAASKNLELQYYVAAAGTPDTTYSLGVGDLGDSDEVEIFSQLVITKIG